MHILMISDAWHPQTNGVVRTLEKVISGLEARGHGVSMITPEHFATMPLPTYPEIRLSLAGKRMLMRQIRELAPDRIHLVTEGPLGLAARRACSDMGVAFTTSFHTKLPEYLRARVPVPTSVSYAMLRWFHNGGRAVLAPTQSICADLAERGFSNVVQWTRGVDLDLYHPRPGVGFPQPVGGAGPYFLYVGRVAVEKNICAFLDCELPGQKIVVGDGPQLVELKALYPQVHFLGRLVGEDLARAYAASDVFVFPSKTDTFGIVMLEAMASGLPVAAYPVAGPLDVVGDSNAGVLHDDLQKACRMALDVPQHRAIEHASGFTWDSCVDVFEDVVCGVEPNQLAA
ncbi:MAG: glycosyltransferase family 1 protein [Pseudomonadota bacterium]